MTVDKDGNWSSEIRSKVFIEKYKNNTTHQVDVSFGWILKSLRHVSGDTGQKDVGLCVDRLLVWWYCQERVGKRHSDGVKFNTIVWKKRYKWCGIALMIRYPSNRKVSSIHRVLKSSRHLVSLPWGLKYILHPTKLFPIRFQLLLGECYGPWLTTTALFPRPILLIILGTASVIRYYKISQS